MKYRIEAWVYHSLVDEFETDSLEEARKWWKENWKKEEDCGEAYCEWYINGEVQTIEKVIELEGKE